MPKMNNPELLRSKLTEMRQQRDYWYEVATRKERELKIAAKCVRDLLRFRKAAAKWLAELVEDEPPPSAEHRSSAEK